MTELLAIPESVAAISRRAELLAAHPRLADPVAAISFALDFCGPCAEGDFLETWRDGAWDEIEAAYPEFLTSLRP